MSGRILAFLVVATIVGPGAVLSSDSVFRLPPVGGNHPWIIRGQASMALTALDEPARFDAVAATSVENDLFEDDVDPCDECPGRWLDNAVFAIGGNAWENIFDDDDSSNFGLRVSANLGFKLGRLNRLRGQFGVSYAGYDFHGREATLVGGNVNQVNVVEQQMFITAGVYRAADPVCGEFLSWGVVYDQLVGEDAGEMTDEINLGQIRVRIGWALDECNEIGTWMAFRAQKDFAGAQNVAVLPTDQFNVFWQRTWSYGGTTMFYVGVADDPGDTSIGFRGLVPLSDHTALYGSVHHLIPSTRAGDSVPQLNANDVFNQDTWSIGFGIVVYPGRNAGGARGLPLLPVADNASFNYQAQLF